MDFVFKSAVQIARRKPVLWLIKDGEIYRFSDEPIPGVVEVNDEDRLMLESDGSWSVSTYYLSLSPGVIPCVLVASMHGRLWPDKSLEDAYKRVKEQFGLKDVSSESFVTAMRRDFPLASNRMGYGEQDPTSEDWEKSNCLPEKKKKKK